MTADWSDCTTLTTMKDLQGLRERQLAQRKSAIPGSQQTSCRCKEPTVPYSYQPLIKNGRSTRIIELLPGRARDRLRCHMLEVSVEPGVSYDALSYTWTPVLPRDCIEVDEHHLIYWRESFRCFVRAEIYKPSTQTVGRCDLYQLGACQ